jgi:hypothetical protein
MPAPRRLRLEGAWMHSHEEDASGEWVFRPATFKFPPSRGRQAITLSPDGSYQDRVPGPDDRGVAGDGTWAMTETDDLVLTPAAMGASPRVFRVVSATKAKLVVIPR